MLKPDCGHIDSGGGTGCAFPYGWEDDPEVWPIENLNRYKAIDTIV